MVVGEPARMLFESIPLGNHEGASSVQEEFKNRRKSRSRRDNEAQLLSRQDPPPNVDGYNFHRALPKSCLTLDSFLRLLSLSNLMSDPTRLSSIRAWHVTLTQG